MEELEALEKIVEEDMPKNVRVGPCFYFLIVGYLRVPFGWLLLKARKKKYRTGTVRLGPL